VADSLDAGDRASASAHFIDAVLADWREATQSQSPAHAVDLPTLERQLHDRLTQWAPDLVPALAEVYSLPEIAAPLARIIARGFAARPQALRQRDEARLRMPDHLQTPDRIGYATYVDQFAGTLTGVTQHIDHLRSLGITYLHLLPLLHARPAPNDGGYAVMDYRSVQPELGTMDDLAKLADDLHEAGIDLTIDLVLNHVAQEHSWAVKARQGDPKYRNYFYIFDDRTLPDQFDQTVSEVFPEFAPGNFTYNEDLQGWVWTTFNSWQWDVNWTNPDVFCEFVDIIVNLANKGVDCLRLDAIAFIAKQMGTSCQNLPEVHVLTQALRSVLRIVAPSLSFKAEAIVGPDDLVQYLGLGRFAGKISDLAYNNALMVHIWSTLATSDARLMAHALNRLPEIPATATWVTYIRCHDDIGWAIDDADAGAVGWGGAAHRSFLAAYYRGDFPDSPARGADFQENPAIGDRRTSGSAASLTGLEAALDSHDERGIELAQRRLLMAHAMIYGFGGIPLLWMGDEIALLNDRDYVDDPDHADDNRWLHRPRMDWNLVERVRAGSDDDPQVQAAGVVLRGLQHLAAVRSQLPQLHASTPTMIHVPEDPAVVIFDRSSEHGVLVEVYNTAATPRTVSAAALQRLQIETFTDVLDMNEVSMEGGIIHLAPYGAHWFTA
jgi:amylosucrase